MFMSTISPHVGCLHRVQCMTVMWYIFHVRRRRIAPETRESIVNETFMLLIPKYESIVHILLPLLSLVEMLLGQFTYWHWIELICIGLGMGLCGRNTPPLGTTFDRRAECAPHWNRMFVWRWIKRLITSACKHAHYSVNCVNCESTIGPHKGNSISQTLSH